MSMIGELEHFASRTGADVQRFVNEGKQELTQHVTEHPQPLFELLRAVKPVLQIHDIAIITRYADVIEVLSNEKAFGVEPYIGKMQALVGDFILGLDDSPEYERHVSILRLAAPRSDIPKLASFVADTAEALVAESAGRNSGQVAIPDLAARIPARLAARWLGTPGPAAARVGDDDALRAVMWEAMRFAPQGPGLLRRARSDFVVAAGSLHETRISAGTITLAATESAMLDGDVVDDPHEFRPGRPAHHYLHFGTGLHTCFGRFANEMQIPQIANALLRRGTLARAPGDAGKLVKHGPYPVSLAVTIAA